MSSMKIGVTNSVLLKSIEETNAIIAKFMGGKVRVAWSFKDRDVYVWEGDIAASFRRIEKLPAFPNILIENLRFHESWDWLMPVVEKIESIKNDHHGHFKTHISSNTCNIQGTNLWKAMKDCSDYGYVYMSDPNAILDSKFDSAYYSVVQFIKWHNEQCVK